ncbi:hypothetical protein O9K51_05005 [Purpureocillium lavendulum]|uniref:Ankyrin n=1 Tax=Purpureocillium lavendulum TaxID=1247861 RepID=A0AB34FRM8_9HYPO|nr:hypothetical protein O9K51_05005 [Purpureocillium lavendulum]
MSQPRIELLLEKCTDTTDSKGLNGRTPPSWATALGSPSLSKLLLDKGGADANTSDESGRAPLRWATGRDDALAIELLLEVGKADPAICRRVRTNATVMGC